MKLTKRRHCAPLTATQLASMDDAAIDVTIDEMPLLPVNFPATTRKSSANYCPLQSIDRKALGRILMKRPFNLKEKTRRILRLSCLKHYRSPEKKPNQRSKWFEEQLQAYIQIYDPKCPFKIAESKYLSSTDSEAAVVAKDLIKPGKIPFLSGICVPLTKEEERQLETLGKDFSILQSARTQKTAMFLGPARFVNHDCQANSQIVRPNNSSAYIVALKDIPAGDEITVFYGKDYFGENNHECSCRSCATAIRTAD